MMYTYKCCIVKVIVIVIVLAIRISISSSISINNKKKNKLVTLITFFVMFPDMQYIILWV